MKVTISFGRELTLATFSGLARYSEVLESQLVLAGDTEKDSIRRQIESMNLDQDSAFVELDLAMQEHDMTFDMLLPNFFRYSFIVLLCLVFENKLGELSELVHHNRPDLPAPPHPRQDAIKEYKKYFIDIAAISDLNWDKLLELNKVRNCIVHASGKVHGFRHETFLVQLAAKDNGLHISGPTHDHSQKLRPLYLDDDMLVLETQYCIDAAREVREFFVGLCDSIGLSPMLIETDRG
jgi:hypothetical protein